MPYRQLQRGAGTLGSGIREAIDRRTDRKDNEKLATQKRTMIQNLMESNEYWQGAMAGVDINDLGPNQIDELFNLGGAALKTQREQQMMQQDAHEMQSRQANEAAWSPIADLFPEDHPVGKYVQAGGRDPQALSMIQELFPEETGKLQFHEDPVSRHRFATFGRNMAGSGINPEAVADAPPAPQSSYGKLAADIQAARAAGDNESAELLERIGQRLAQGAMPNALDLRMYARELKGQGFSDDDIRTWMQDRLGINPAEAGNVIEGQGGKDKRNEVTRIIQGRRAIFDKETREFLRWAD